MPENKRSKVSFSVPTGNFGDILAGFYARVRRSRVGVLKLQRLGVPIGELIVATNENDILHRFFTTGYANHIMTDTRSKYHRRKVQHTISPSMDICVSSNFERYLFALCDDDPHVLKSWMDDFEKTGELTIEGEYLEKAKREMSSSSATFDQIQSTMKEIWSQEKYLLDPHTCVGFVAAKSFSGRKFAPMVVVGTAHPGKFLPTVFDALDDSNIPQHPILKELDDKPTRHEVLPHDLDIIQMHIRDVVKGRRTSSWIRTVHTHQLIIGGISIVLLAALVALKRR